jgi:hypothetical protein
MSMYDKIRVLISEIRNLKGSFTDFENPKIAISENGNFYLYLKGIFR